MAPCVVADIDDPDADKRLYTAAVHFRGAIGQSSPSIKKASTRADFTKAAFLTIQILGLDGGETI